MIGAKVDTKGFLAGVRRLQKTDGRKVFRFAKKPMRMDLRDHSKKMTDDGARWQPRAQSTLDRRGRKRGGKRGKLLGRLPAAFKITSGSEYVRATSLVRWSKVHNEGGRAGHGAQIPKRKFMWLSQVLIYAVRDLWTQAMKRAWQGTR